MTNRSRKHKLVGLFIAGAILVFLIGRWVIYPTFPIEERHVIQDGGARFEKMSLNRLGLLDWEEGLEMNLGSKPSIRHMIYGNPAVYVFTTDSYVFALMGNESGVPASVVEKWEWRGNPHEFPHYDKTYPFPGP